MTYQAQAKRTWKIEVASDRKLVLAVEVAGPGEVVRAEVIGGETRQCGIIGLAHVLGSRERKLQVCVLDSRREVYNLLLQAEVESGEHRSAIREIHHVHAEVGMQARESAGWAGRATGDLRGPTYSRGTIGTECASGAKCRDHAADLACSGRASVCDLCRVPVIYGVDKIECTHAPTVVHVNSEKISRGNVTENVNIEYQAGPQFVLNSDIHLH